MTLDDVAKLESEGNMQCLDYELSTEDVIISYELSKEALSNEATKMYKATANAKVCCIVTATVTQCAQMIVLLDMTEDASFVAEGMAREVVNRMQKQRKTAKLQVSGHTVRHNA